MMTHSQRGIFRLNSVLVVVCLLFAFSAIVFAYTQGTGNNGISYVPIPAISKITNTNLTGYAYESTNFDYKAYFKNDSDLTRSVRFIKNGYTFDFDMSIAQAQWYNSATGAIMGNPLNPAHVNASISGNKITYPGAWTGVNLTYELLPSELKESFVITSVPTNTSAADFFRYRINVFYNSTLRVCLNNGTCYLNPSSVSVNTTDKVYFKDANNVTVFYLPAPFIVDKNGNTFNATYFFSLNNGVDLWYIGIPRTFIRTANTTGGFPITLDPTIISTDLTLPDLQGIKYTPECIADCHLPFAISYTGILEPASIDLTPGSRNNIDWFLSKLNVSDDIAIDDIKYLKNVSKDISQFTPVYVNNTYTIVYGFNPPSGCYVINETHYNCTTLASGNQSAYNTTYPIPANTTFVAPGTCWIIDATHYNCTEISSVTPSTLTTSELKWTSIFSDTLTMYKDTVYYFDFIGHRTPKIGTLSTDIVPSINGFNLSELAWWNASYLYKQQINVTASSSGLLTPFVINYTINHATLVSAGKSLPNASDITILYYNTTTGLFTELDRINITQANTASLQLLFRLQNNITASATDTNYWVYYGFLTKQTAPKNNASNVAYKFQDNRAGTTAIWQLEEGTGTTINDIGGSVNDAGVIAGGVGAGTNSSWNATDGIVDSFTEYLVNGWSYTYNGNYGNSNGYGIPLNCQTKNCEFSNYVTSKNFTLYARFFMNNYTVADASTILDAQGGTFCSDDIFGFYVNKPTHPTQAKKFEAFVTKNDASCNPAAKINSVSDIPTGQWVTVIINLNEGQSNSLWINGKLDSTSATSGGTFYNGSGASKAVYPGIGFWQSCVNPPLNNTCNFNGTFAEVALFNRSVTSAEAVFWNYRRGNFQTEPTLLSGLEKTLSMNWSKKAKITINTSNILFAPNFTAMLTLNSSIIDFSKVNSDCSDIAFRNSTENGVVRYWRESCREDANNKTVVWINWGNVTTDPYIYVYYNNSNVDDESTTFTFPFVSTYDNQPAGVDAEKFVGCTNRGGGSQMIRKTQTNLYVSPANGVTWTGSYDDGSCIEYGTENLGAIGSTTPWGWHLNVRFNSAASDTRWLMNRYRLTQSGSVGNVNTFIGFGRAGMYDNDGVNRTSMILGTWYSVTGLQNVSGSVSSPGTAEIWKNGTLAFSHAMVSWTNSNDMIVFAQEGESGAVNASTDNFFMFNATSTMPSYTVQDISVSIPTVTFVAPTRNSGVISPFNFAYVNVTVNDSANIDTCTLEWNGINETMTKNATGPAAYCYVNKTGLTVNVTNNYKVFANNTGNGTGNTTYITYTYHDQAPAITYVAPTPASGSVIGTTYIYINATVFDTFNVSDCTVEFLNVNYSTTKVGTGQNVTCFKNFTGLVDGFYNHYHVFANDSANNTGATGERTFYVDTTAPIVTFVLPTPTDGLLAAKNYVYVNITVVDTLSAVDSCRVQFNGTNLTMTKVGTGLSVTCFLNVTDLNETTHNFKAFANDSGNNFGNTTLYTYTYLNDTTIPAVYIFRTTDMNGVLVGRNVSINVNYTDQTTVNWNLSVYYPNGTYYESYAGNVNSTFNITTLSSDPVGNYTVVLNGTDSAGLANGTTDWFGLGNYSVSINYSFESRNYTSRISAWGNVTPLNNDSSTDLDVNKVIQITWSGICFNCSDTLNLNLSQNFIGTKTLLDVLDDQNQSILYTVLPDGNITFNLTNTNVSNVSTVRYNRIGVRVPNMLHYSYTYDISSNYYYGFTSRNVSSNVHVPIFAQIDLPSAQDFQPINAHLDYQVCVGGADLTVSPFSCTTWASITSILSSTNGNNVPNNVLVDGTGGHVDRFSMNTTVSDFLMRVVLEGGSMSQAPAPGAGSGGGVTFTGNVPAPTCGNLICEVGETMAQCPEDCVNVTFSVFPEFVYVSGAPGAQLTCLGEKNGCKIVFTNPMTTDQTIDIKFEAYQASFDTAVDPSVTWAYLYEGTNTFSLDKTIILHPTADKQTNNFVIVSVNPPKDAKPGDYQFRIRVTDRTSGEVKIVKYQVRVAKFDIKTFLFSPLIPITGRASALGYVTAPILWLGILGIVFLYWFLSRIYRGSKKRR